MMAAADTERAHLLRRGRRLEHLTIGWNAIEALVAIVAGVLAGSIALVGFGGDSVIETVAAVVVLRRLSAEIAGREREAKQKERRARRVIAVTFFVLAVYILLESSHTLLERRAPAVSGVGIGLAVASLVVMPTLAWWKKRTGVALGSRALQADAAETFVCAYLSLALLLGLGLNALAGWWWADPAAALLMIPFVLYEGREALEDSAEEPAEDGA